MLSHDQTPYCPFSKLFPRSEYRITIINQIMLIQLKLFHSFHKMCSSHSHQQVQATQRVLILNRWNTSLCLGHSRLLLDGHY
jgi:hypothetical protein